MNTLLQKIHAKPEVYRQNLALGITIGVSAIIFSLWVISLPSRLASINTKSTTTNDENLANAGAAFSNMSDNISGAVDDAHGQMDGLLKVINK